MNVYDEMIDAALDTHVQIMLGVKPGEMDRDGDAWHTARAAMGLALAAALDAAPTVEVAAISGTWFDVWSCDYAEGGPLVRDRDYCEEIDCPGPHRSLILGQVTPSCPMCDGAGGFGVDLQDSFPCGRCNGNGKED